MDIDKEVTGLDGMVKLLLERADKMRLHIESHEFSLAEIEANALALYCAGANELANRIADAI